MKGREFQVPYPDHSLDKRSGLSSGVRKISEAVFREYAGKWLNWKSKWLLTTRLQVRALPSQPILRFVVTFREIRHVAD